MIVYECYKCGKTCELEVIEAILFSHNHEYYEADMCEECFEKSLEEE